MTTSGEDPRERNAPPDPPSGQPYGGQPPTGAQAYGYPLHGGQPPPSAAPATAVSADDRNWAMAAHVGSFLAAWVALGLLAPLVVLLARGNGSPYVRQHAVESLNFQINALVYIAVFVMLSFVLIGIPLLIAYGIFYLICVILGTVRASNGQAYRYPATIRFVS